MEDYRPSMSIYGGDVYGREVDLNAPTAVMDSNCSMASTISEPCDSMEFESHEAAYTFYKEYAKSVGFGTAKLSSRRSRASKEFIDAKFSCIRYGNKQQSDDAINPRPSPKIGCKASMHVKRRQDGKWYIYSFVKEHNHELLPAQAHFFRSHRDTDQIKNDIRLKRRKNVSAASRLFGAYRNVDFLESYMRNQHDKGRKLVLDAGDAQLLLEFFMLMQEENPKFFYAIDLNEEHRLRNVFWVDAKGKEDYSHFSDVVSFDTRYSANEYKIPLVLFVGVNHHIQPTLLGCALVADETVYTYAWLLQTWFVAMGERAPQVFLSDQNNAIKTVVAAVLPGTRHCFCLWHILEKIPRQLDLGMWHDSFVEKFNKCIFKSWTEEQFEKRWWKLVEKFNLREAEWISSLYEDRVRWAPTFMKGVSFAGLSASSRSDSLNSLFDTYIQVDTSLRGFIEQYRVILEDKYEEEAKANFDAWHETPDLKSPSPFEKQMLLVYTHEIFKKFQVEVLGAAACHLKKEGEEGMISIFSVKDFEDNQNYVVEWNESNPDIHCSCHSFEYKGYLCRHAIVVLQMSGVFTIPTKYVLQRWTNAALSRHSVGERLDKVQSKVRRFNDLCRRAIILGEEGSLSHESYNFALGTISDALKQCASLHNSIKNYTIPNASVIGSVCSTEEELQSSNTSNIHTRDVNMTGSTSGGAVKELRNVDNSTGREGKVLQLDSMSGQDVYHHHMEEIASRQLNIMPMPIPIPMPSGTPAIFHNASTQYQNAALANLHENHLPRYPK